MIRRIPKSAVVAATTRNFWSTIIPRHRLENRVSPEVGFVGSLGRSHVEFNPFESLLESVQSASALRSGAVASRVTSDVLGAEGNCGLLRVHRNIICIDGHRLLFQLRESHGTTNRRSLLCRTFTSRASDKQGRSATEAKKEISTVEDPFDAPTYHIPEKPVTFVEGASYSVIILAGLGVAAAAAYAVFSELIFQPKEYKVYNMALKRIQDDSQVRVRIGSPITGYGQESRNRAARQRIPHRIWTDEDGVEQIEVNFYIRGPHGAGKVFCRMFKDNVDRQWKFTSLIVQIMSPSPAQLLLESYVPA